MRIAGKVTMVTVALVAAAALSACGNSEQNSGATPQNDCTADDIKVDGDFGAKPTITIPATCKQPSGLLTKDLKTGAGPEVKNGSVVETNYLLQTWSDKQIVDNSFDRSETLAVEGVGTGQVIKGWDQGLLGLKEGGRRLMIIPPALGYPNGSGPIKAGETLVFVTDAVKVTG
jgi:peptidylprolyl isomerase